MSLGHDLNMLDEGISRIRKIIPEMPEDAALCRMLLLISQRMQEQFEQKLKPHKLNDSEFRSLMMLFSKPDGSSTPSELCVFTSEGATNMTRITDALVKRGLITRGPSAEDRRRVVLKITANGRRFVQKMLPTMFPSLQLIFAGFNDADRRNLSRLLRKLAHNLCQIEENEAGDPS
jgi:MarR family transcriptional regulator, negative regulator of the multidrug operon emrRAB